MGCHSLLALFCVSCQPTGIVGAHVRMCSAPAKPCRHKKIKTTTIESMDSEGSEFSSYILEPRPKMPSKHNAHSFISQELQWLYAPRTNILLLWLRSIKHIKEHLLDNGVVFFIFFNRAAQPCLCVSVVPSVILAISCVSAFPVLKAV